MKTINEMFKNKPELLEEPEVKELVEQFKYQFNQIKTKYQNYVDRVTTLTMNSDCFVINGMPCADVVEKINDLSFKVD